MGLPEILRFSTVSSKYFKNVSGELCCLYITPQIIFAALAAYSNFESNDMGFH